MRQIIAGYRAGTRRERSGLLCPPLGLQFHPKFCSRPTNPHPLFRDSIAAASATLPEGTQRALPLIEKSENGVEEGIFEDRVLAVSHES